MNRVLRNGIKMHFEVLTFSSCKNDFPPKLRKNSGNLNNFGEIQNPNVNRMSLDARIAGKSINTLSTQLHCYALLRVVISYEQGQAAHEERSLNITFWPRTDGVVISGFYCTNLSHICERHISLGQVRLLLPGDLAEVAQVCTAT